MANSIKLDDRYNVLYSQKFLLFDNRMKKAVQIDPRVANRLADLAKLRCELVGLGTTMTMSLTLPGEKTEIQIRFEPAAEEIELDKSG